MSQRKSGKTQLQTTMDLLDGALRTLEDLKPQCVDSTMSYEERKAPGARGAEREGMEKRLKAKIWEMRQKSMLYIYNIYIYIHIYSVHIYTYIHCMET